MAGTADRTYKQKSISHEDLDLRLDVHAGCPNFVEDVCLLKEQKAISHKVKNVHLMKTILPVIK